MFFQLDMNFVVQKDKLLFHKNCTAGLDFKPNYIYVGWLPVSN